MYIRGASKMRTTGEHDHATNVFREWSSEHEHWYIGVSVSGT